jgi:type II secretory pathway component GspD/PulD (secretin)
MVAAFGRTKRQKQDYRMKLKTSILLMVGLLGFGLAGFAQTDNSDTNSTVVAAADPPVADAAPPAAAVDTAAAAQPESADTNAGVTTDINAGTAPAVADPGAVIPLIVMDDVPLTDAIRNLARQANLNYMLDPSLSFGKTGPDGRAVPQPTISIRWENITAQQALGALLNNYNLQITDDPKNQIARITVRDPAAPDPLVTKVIQLKYASPTNILVSLQASLTDKRSRALADIRTSQIVVLATEKETRAMDSLVERLDTPTKQVLIEARLVETSMSPSTAKGMDWQGTLANQNLYFGNSVGDNPFGSLLTMSPNKGSFFNPSTFFLNADGVKLVFSYLNQYAEVKVLSNPRTVTLDNEPATIEVVRASPIINVTAGTANTTGGSQIQYTNLGVILHVTPRISANNYVNLRVVPEVSRVFETISRQVGSGASGGTFEADVYDIRKIETHVMVPSGNTLVMGGMVQDDIRRGNSKVPVLGDIPGLGYAFRKDTKKRQQSNLLVFLTPTIVQDQDFQPTSTDFLKTPVPTKDTLEPEWNAWDSGKPKDWSKKKEPTTGGSTAEFSDPSPYVKN